MPMSPSSNPLNGNIARNPPIPNMPSIPMLQEVHAGANTPMRRLEDPAPTEPLICLLIKNTLSETTTPATIDIMISKDTVIGGMPVIPPMKRKKINFQEKLERSTR